MFHTIKRELRNWREWLQVLGLLGLIAGGCVLLAVFWVVFACLVGVFVAGFVIAWACGTKFTVKRADVPIGYLRWFTYHTER